jgi:ABC-type transport system involved in multi-copper enzyme maturation permease subunit
VTAFDVSATRSTPFTRLVKVELRKTYDTRAGFWLLAVISLIVLAAETIFLLASAHNDEKVELGDFVGVAAFITSIFLPVLGILLVTSEWSQRTAMVTFALEPRRSRVVLAKLATGVVLTLVTAGIATVLGVILNAMSIALQGEGSWTLGWNFFFGFLMVQSITMAGGFALGALLLSTPAALVVFFIYKWALPGLMFAGTSSWAWFKHIGPWINFQDALGPVGELTLNTAQEWGRLLVSGSIWLLLPLLIGMRRILRAEVK